MIGIGMSLINGIMVGIELSPVPGVYVVLDCFIVRILITNPNEFEEFEDEE